MVAWVGGRWASRPEAIHDSCYPQRARIEPGPKLAESGSIILTAHSFLPSLAEIRLGWSRANEEETEWMVATLTRLANRS